MWSSESADLDKVALILDHQPMLESALQFHPIPYTFSKLENGKKKATDATCVTPPSWLLLDHTIAVIWSIFTLDPKLQALSIDDFKWAYEFLKGIKNQNGANPPDVKVCLKEIEDRLIHLYAKLTSSESEEFNDPEEDFCGDVENSDTDHVDTSYFSKDIESSSEMLSLSSTKEPSPLLSRKSSQNLTAAVVKAESTQLDDFPFLEEDSDWGETEEMEHNEEVEKYVLRLFEDEKKEEALQAKSVPKSLIPKVKKKPASVMPEAVSSESTAYGTRQEKKTSKKVHCIAQMRSLQFQKSMKVKNTNGEQAAYSKLKAEILTIKPNTSKEEIMKILKEWRSEQTRNEHKKVRGLEEYMKNLNDGLKPNFHVNSTSGLKGVNKTSSEKNYRPRRLLS